MENQDFFYALPLYGVMFRAKCRALFELKTKIHLYLNTLGLSDKEALTLINAGSGRKDLGIGTDEEQKIVADMVFESLEKGVSCFDVSMY